MQYVEKMRRKSDFFILKLSHQRNRKLKAILLKIRTLTKIQKWAWRQASQQTSLKIKVFIRIFIIQTAKKGS